MNKSKEMLLVFLIVLTLISTVLLIVIISNLNTQKNSINNGVDYSQEIGGSILDEYVNASENKISKSAYFNVNACIAQYLDILNINKSVYYGYNENGQYTLVIGQEEIKQNIYDVLSEQYIKRNNITIQNLYDHVKVVEKQTLYVPLEIALIQDKEIKSFLVHGLIETSNFQVVDELFAVINIDMNNNVFSIEPIFGEYTSINQIKVNELDNTIKISDNNKFNSYAASYEEIVKDYINIYKRLALGNYEKMYNMLDVKYREKRFQNLDGFKNYIEQNKEEIKSIRVEKYKVNQADGNMQYIAIDQNENYYIITEKDILNYSIILDTYTLDLPEFIEKYQSASEDKKVLMNIQKFFTAIEAQDYRYAYNKLDETFKTNNFPTLAEFENYVKTTFFENNSLAAGTPEKQNNIYVYEVTISDKSKQSTQKINKTFVMQLKEGTDFVMSFSK